MFQPIGFAVLIAGIWLYNDVILRPIDILIIDIPVVDILIIDIPVMNIPKIVIQIIVIPIIPIIATCQL